MFISFINFENFLTKICQIVVFTSIISFLDSNYTYIRLPDTVSQVTEALAFLFFQSFFPPSLLHFG